MPFRSVRMKRFILGFHLRVWCPKWTPLSRSWRTVTTAMARPFGTGACPHDCGPANRPNFHGCHAAVWPPVLAPAIRDAPLPRGGVGTVAPHPARRRVQVRVVNLEVALTILTDRGRWKHPPWCDVVHRLSGGAPRRERPRWMLAAMTLVHALAVIALGLSMLPDGATADPPPADLAALESRCAPEARRPLAAGAAYDWPTVVAFAGWVVDRHVVSIDHADGIRTTYEPVLPAVATGQWVSRGEVIGTLEPGHCDGGCLHVGARRGADTYIDPLTLFTDTVIRPVSYT